MRRRRQAAQLTGKGVDVKKEPIDLPKGDHEWTCGSRLEVTTDFYHGCSDAIAAGNIPLATQYYQTAELFQHAFDAQCGPLVE